MKTLTKRQLIEILDKVPDDAPVYIYVELDDVELAGSRLVDEIPVLQFGLPGDHSIDDDGIGLLTWVEE